MPLKLLETMRWEGGYRHLDAHLERLSRSAHELGIPVCLGRVEQELEQATSSWNGPMRVRLLVDAQSVELQSAPLVPLPEPYLIGLSSTPVSADDPLLRHKLIPRDTYDQALASRPDCHDVLLWNERGELTESCIANLVLEISEKLWTPAVASGLLPGVGRRVMLEQGQVEERVLVVEDLDRCEGVWLVNSLRGLWRAHLADLTPGNTPRTR